LKVSDAMKRSLVLSSRALVTLFAGLVLPMMAIADPGTAEDRAALFDYILRATMQRTAFSPFKPLDVGASAQTTEAELVREAMLELREEFVAADSDTKLYYALVKVSATRRDSHLTVRTVSDGIVPFAASTQEAEAHAPIKFKPDYSDPSTTFMYVSDYAADIGRIAGRTPAIGDRLVTVNGESADAWLKRLAQFIGRSSRRALWWTMAELIAQRSRQVEPSLHGGECITFELESPGRGRYTLSLPFLKYETIKWAGYDDHYSGRKLAELIQADLGFIGRTHQIALSVARYRGFEHVFSSPSFDLYASNARKVLLLQFHRFVPKLLVGDIDRLLSLARASGWLDYGVIYDITRSSGGDFEEYTLQRLQSRPFKIMFGNLRISDVTPELVTQIRAEPDSGRYLLDWLDRDVAAALRAGQAYTNDVQFKNQSLPTTSDGYLYPAKEHFTGPMVLLTAPFSCSGTDQFAAMFIDNGLGLSVGMPQGGCSNTWEWDEVLKLPSSGKPVARFNWSAGHSIRPNGEVLEGNPAWPRVFVPLTRDNYSQYYELMLKHALSYIDAQRASKGREPTRLDRITDGRKVE
jgi:hypothetical protein